MTAWLFISLPQGALTLKMYTKGERVLRCEVIVHNVRKLKQGNSLMRWVPVVTHLNEVLDGFLEVVQCADSATLDDGVYESLPEPSAVGAAHVAGINLARTRMAAVMAAVVVPFRRNRLDSPAATWRSKSSNAWA